MLRSVKWSLHVLRLKFHMHYAFSPRFTHSTQVMTIRDGYFVDPVFDKKLSLGLTLIISSRATGHVKRPKFSDVSEHASVAIVNVTVTLMTGTEMVPETSKNFNHLTWLMTTIFIH